MKKNYLNLLCIALCAALILSGCNDNLNPNDPNGGGNPEEKDPYSDEVVAMFRGMESREAGNEIYDFTDPIVTEESEVKDYVDVNDNGTVKYDAKKVVSSKKYTIQENALAFASLNPWADLFPGALVTVSSLDKEEIPSVIPIVSKRKPNSIYLSMVAGADVSISRDSIIMESSEAHDAMNEILSDYYNSCDTAGFYAHSAFTMQEVQSLEQLAFHLGVDVNFNKVKLGTQLTDFSDMEYNYIAVKLNQIYFTMACDGPDLGYRGVFLPSIRSYELEDYGITSSNPLCYIKSIAYGRSYAMVYKSKRSKEELTMAVNAAFSYGTTGASSELNDTHVKVFNESDVSVIQIGGDAQGGLQGAFGDVNALRRFIIEGSTPSRKNVGAPISYQVAYVHNNKNFVNTTTTSYSISETVYTPSDGSDLFKMKFYRSKSIFNPKRKKISCHSHFNIDEITVEHTDDQPEQIYANTNNDYHSLSTTETEQPLYSTYSKVLKNGKEFKVGDEITVTISYSYRHRSYPGSGYDSGNRTGTKTLSYLYEKEGSWVIQEENADYGFNSIDFKLVTDGGESTHKLNFSIYFRGAELQSN